MAKKKRGGAARAPSNRLTAARWVSEAYGEKGLRALRAMGPEFSRCLQDEILHVRRRNELLDRKARLEKAISDLNERLVDIGEWKSDMGSCFPRLEMIVKALPDIAREKPTADEPKEKAPEGEPVEASTTQG